MTIRLLTAAGGFVSEAVVPDFTPPPEVIVWGARVFIAPVPEELLRLLTHERADMAYVEAFAYVLP